jgi:Domain of unknown function (DUF5020)
MKYLLCSALILLTMPVFPQNIQLHYDLRHSLDPNLNPKNFPSFSFEYFKNIDTLNNGSFLLKLDSRLDGKKSNMGQVFTQLSQSIKFWKPKIYLSLTYSGGLGVTSTNFGYYLSNSFGIGSAYTFQLNGAWVSVCAYFRVNVFDKPSYDPQATLWFGKGFLNYKIYFAGSFVFWSQNRNQGDDATRDLRGKKIAFFGDPQIWFRIKGGFSAGSKINVYYHLLSDNNQIQFYPTLGLKYQL